MLKKYFIMAIAAVFALVACTEKFDEPGILPAGSDNVHTLSVGIEAGTYTPAEGGTKASMEAVIRVNWTANDEVSVVNATKGKILGGCLKAQEGGTSVVFEGTVTGTINQGDKLYYIYPKLAGNTDAETEFSTDGYNQSLANQTYNGNDPGKVCFYGYAEDVASTNTVSKKIQFNLVTSYAHLNMANLPAKGADLSSLDISNVNEGFTWTLSDATLTAAPYAGSNSISVDCTNSGISQSGNAVVRFAIPSSAASEQDRVITVNNAYKNKNYTKAELLSSSYHNQLYTSWESNVSVTSQTGKTEVTITNEGSTEVAEGVLPVEQAFDVTKPTEIGIGGVGTITFNETATSNIKSNASGSTEVFFKIEDVTETQQVQNANLVYEITMKTVDGNGTEVFSKDNAGTGSEATVVIELGQSVQSVESVSLVDENGNPITGDAVKNVNFDSQTGKLTFTVVHFSKYAIKYTTKAEPESGYVAQIGGRKYETLASAIAAAQNGNTIKLLCDCMDAEGIIVPEGKNFTLDFGGQTYKVTKDLAGSTGTKNQCFQLLKGSTLVFQNGTITTSCAKLGINSYSDLILKDVTVDMSQTSATDAQIVCLQTCNGNTSLQGNTNLIAKEDRLAILALYWPNAYGDINVELNTTGEVKGLMAYGSYQVQDLSTVAQHSHVAIKNGKYDVTFDMDELENYDFKIYGGVFKASPDTKYLAPNHEVVTNTDSETSASYPHKVQQKPYVAQIGDTKYFTLVAAVAAVPANTPTTVTLLENIGSKEGDVINWEEYDRVYVYTINKDQNVTFDLNGHKIFAKTTVNGETCFFRVENGGTLTIKDSSEGGELNYLDGNDNTGGFVICSAGNLTIEKGTIENHTVCNNSSIQGAIDVHANEWGTTYYADHVTFKMNGGVLKSYNDNTLRLYDSSQTGTDYVVIDSEINGGEIYGKDAVFIMTQWTKTYCTGTDTYMNNINLSVKGGKFVTNNGIRVVGNVGENNNKDYKAIKINVSGGDFTIYNSEMYRVNNVAFQSSSSWESTDSATENLRSYTEVSWTAAEPTYTTPAQQ